MSVEFFLPYIWIYDDNANSMDYIAVFRFQACGLFIGDSYPVMLSYSDHSTNLNRPTIDLNAQVTVQVNFMANDLERVATH